MAAVISDAAVEFANGLTVKFADKDLEFVAMPGNKYNRIATTENGHPANAHAFVEVETGHVFKSAGWARPAPHVRYTDVAAALEAADPYGSYLYI